MKRVKGIGGIFFRSSDPDALKQWYITHLGLNPDAYGVKFDWREVADSSKDGYTLWSPFPKDTDYFGSPSQAFMINFTVEDLESLVEELKKEGVTILDTMERYDFGKFIHIQDPEGNRIELWEPMNL